MWWIILIAILVPVIIIGIFVVVKIVSKKDYDYDDSYWEDKWHRNPVKQNNGHCVILKKKLNNRYWINNVVIFHELEDGLGINSKYTYTANEFGNYYSSLDDVIPENSLKVIYQKLEPYVATFEELEKHREWIKRKYND